MRAFLPIRGQDAHGSGHYLAPRGDRKHQGIDFACVPGTAIYPMYSGKVTKLGYPYAKMLQYRYVQVTDIDGIDHRYFYLDPVVQLDEWVSENTIIGVVQELPYAGITHHCHYEAMKDGKYLDPRDFIQNDGIHTGSNPAGDRA